MSDEAVLFEYESEPSVLAVAVVRCDVPATVINVSTAFRPTGRTWFEPIEDEL